jgi:hypothetical protein
MSYLHSFAVGTPANRRQEPLTIEQVAQYAPSAMALRPHESRSDRYTYIPTMDVIQGMMRAGFQPFSASQSRTRIEGKKEFTKHMIRFRHMSATGTVPTELLKVGDVIPEVVLINSHDGTSAYKLIAGLYRLVCSNGLMVSDSEIEAIHVMHKGNILDNVVEGSYRLIEGSQKVVESVQNWTSLQLTDGEQQAFAEAAHTVRFADAEGKVSTPITAAQLLRPRRSEDNGSDLWHTFNRVQENVIKGGLHGVVRDDSGRRLRAVSTRQVKGIDQDVKLNRALWQLGERMAELKKAA